MPRDRIVAFYSGEPDDRGRTLDEILQWSDDSLEFTHDYIQWVFPTPMQSGVNPSAPLVTADTATAFATRPELRQGLARAFDRMLAFYGLRREAAADDVVRIVIDDARLPVRATDWLRPHNHNHLRLTRIMQSLAALGLLAEAKALQRCLVTDVCEGPGAGKITRETRQFWLSAC
jgi:hypothetical protein